MNLKDLARLAGVSAATVSKAFAGSREISESTRRRIFDIAMREGCFDKYNKNKFKKPVIAVLCPEIKSDFYNFIVTLLSREISEKGGIMTLAVTNFDSELTAELYGYFSTYAKVDGVIMLNSAKGIKNATGTPTVVFGKGDDVNIDYIKLDNLSAVYDALRRLKELGHTAIGFAGEGLTEGKLELFKKGMRRIGLPVISEWICISEKRFESAGTDAGERLLSSERMPTAIVAAYDYIAIGLIKTLTENGIRIPEDISVIGMDDISVAPYLEKGLSTVKSGSAQACVTAVEIIMKKIDNRYYKSRDELSFFGEFVERDTTGRRKE